MSAPVGVAGEVQQLKPLDALLEQFHRWAHLWDALASSHEAERRKLLHLAARSAGLNPDLARSWLYGANSQAETAAELRAAAECMRQAAEALRQTTSRIRRAA